MGPGVAAAGGDGAGGAAIVDLAGEPAVALGPEPSVPAAGRHPDLDLDLRIRAGPSLRRDPAEGGKLLVRGRISAQPRGQVGRSLERAASEGICGPDLR